MDELPLTAEECRVLGSLIEKAATTPDQYPLSSNGLRTACNQKTARDPVVAYDERSVDATLLSLRDKGLARTVRGAGQRVFKHKHCVDEAWGLGGAEPVLAVLLLRGPQTAGELRTRTERAHPFEDVAAVEGVLRSLSEHDPPLAGMVPRRPGQKDVRWATPAAPGVDTGPGPPDSAPGRGPAGGTASLGGAPAAAPTPVPADDGPDPTPGRSAGSDEIRRLHDEVAALRRTVERLCAELGVPIEDEAG